MNWEVAVSLNERSLSSKLKILELVHLNGRRCSIHFACEPLATCTSWLGTSQQCFVFSWCPPARCSNILYWLHLLNSIIQTRQRLSQCHHARQSVRSHPTHGNVDNRQFKNACQPETVQCHSEVCRVRRSRIFEVVITKLSIHGQGKRLFSTLYRSFHRLVSGCGLSSCYSQ